MVINPETVTLKFTILMYEIWLTGPAAGYTINVKSNSIHTYTHVARKPTYFRVNIYV